MPSTTNYFENLKLQAQSAATAKKAALDAALAMATQANVDKDTGKISYNTDASGAPKLGTVDVGYKEQQRLTKAGAEAGGTLRSGQLARRQLNEESDYRSKIMGLAADTAAQKTQTDLDTASKIAEYQALYNGNSQPSQAASSVVSSPNATRITSPITKPPTAPTSPAKPKTTIPAKPKTTIKPRYDARRIGGL